MDKLSAGDKSLFHGHLAPGAEAIRNVTGGWGGSWWTGCHGRHFPRGSRSLSTDRSGASTRRWGNIFRFTIAS